MAGIITYSEVESAYQSVKGTGLATGLYSIVSTLAVVITIYKILQNYWAGATDSNSKTPDMKKYMDLLKPLIPYILIIFALPFVISLVEAMFSLMEQNFLGEIGDKPPLDFTEYVKYEEELYATKERPTNMVGMPSWDTMMQDMSDYIRIYCIAPLMLFIDNYLFSFAISGRYIYLILLEMIAPLAVLSLMYKSTENWFFSWLKNMMICYMLVPGFMLANFFATQLFEVLVGNGDMGILMMLFMIALKMYLYKKVAEFTSRLI